MKSITITSMEHLPATPAGDGAAAYHVIAPQEADGLRIAFVCVEPGKEAYSYHWHEQDEEAFFILSGTARVRTPQGDKTVHAGEIITFPAGESGAHVISNPSDSEKLTYLDFGTNHVPDICHLGDIKKLLISSRVKTLMLDEP